MSQRRWWRCHFFLFCLNIKASVVIWCSSWCEKKSIVTHKKFPKKIFIADGQEKERDNIKIKDIQSQTYDVDERRRDKKFLVTSYFHLSVLSVESDRDNLKVSSRRSYHFKMWIRFVIKNLWIETSLGLSFKLDGKFHFVTRAVSWRCGWSFSWFFRWY